MKLYNGDCLEIMKNIPDASVDMILCDLPYGTTACKWDTVIPFESLWEQYNRIIKDNGAIVLFGSEPFSSQLRMSQMKMFKYDWIWKKTRPTNFANAKKQPLRCIEIISVFCKQKTIYFPQGLKRINRTMRNSKSTGGDVVRSDIAESSGKGKLRTAGSEYVQEFTNYPTQVIEFASESKTVHPTQKPVPLLEYLIRTYTNEGDTVLDNCMGSGSTGVACVNTNRDFIGIELEAKYYSIAKNRIKEAVSASQNH